MNKTRLVALVAISLQLGSFVWGRVGENEEELAHRYGAILDRSRAIKSAQGRTYVYGENLRFRSEDWSIEALMINQRCEAISYSKRGEWTEAQFKHLLEVNGGRSQWEEQRLPNPKIHREWKRRDKTVAIWIGGLTIKTPVVEQTIAAVEEKAKEEASKLPKF